MAIDLFDAKTEGGKIMKKLLIISVIFAHVLFANTRNDDTAFVDMARKNYNVALKHEVQPVVESAIFNIMALKSFYPDYNYNQLIKTLEQLIENSSSETVRYKAFLALTYIKNSRWFPQYQFLGEINQEIIFKDISEKINHKLLSLTQN